MKTLLHSCLIYCFMLFTLSCIAQKTSLELKNIEKVEQIVNATDSLFGFSGNILIGQGDRIIFQSANGYANFENNIPNNLNTKFRLASLSKQFTASALLLLEQNGKVDFDKAVSNYLQILKPEIAEKITIHQILSHSSGLARDIESLTEKKLGKSYISIDSIIQLINTSELQFEPGTKWSYSNLGYAIAAKIIENQTELTYGQAMDSLIFKPLGMHNSGHEYSGAKIENMATGHVGLPEGVIRADYEDKSYVIGAGSIYSTIYDLFI
ncbi:MAG: beta-lactamase family protein [Chitinophagales bacterium]|nr:beta-lactamase family protein [Chitinophagales bacterium]